MTEKNNSVKNLMTNIFGTFISLAVFGGVAVFLIYLIGIIIGGESGASLMVFGQQQLVPLIIKAATIGVISGLIIFYITGQHALSLKEETSEKRRIRKNK